jgi:hypothetical protein
MAEGILWVKYTESIFNGEKNTGKLSGLLEES